MGICFLCSRASYSEGNSRMWLEIDLIRDFMLTLVTGKVEEDRGATTFPLL